MKKFFLFATILLTMLLMRPFDAFALEPVLYFSDITSGPATSLGDGKGSGAIVTVWGVNLGSTQGASRVYVGGVPASYVYYWGNADTTGASGPADLYAYHKIQTISFSIPATATYGDNTISVTVNGAQTNTLPFTVRAGDIYFVKTTGNDASSADGSWNNPWKTMVYVGNGSGNAGAGGRVNAGDIVYVGDGVTESTGLPIKYIKGTASAPISLIAYPGAHVTILGPSGWAIGNHNHDASYWNFAKLTLKTKGDGIGTFKGMRAVGNEITNYPGAYATGQGGAITGDNINFPYDLTKDIVGGGIKVFGTYIHDFGGTTTDKLHHIFYISNRGGYAVEAFELGWNYLRDNGAYHALHVYDEGRCGDFTGTMKIHDNVVKNQVGVGVGVSAGNIAGTCISVPINVYNNLFINVGARLGGPDTTHNFAIGMSGPNVRSRIKFYNNTFYGFGDATASKPALFSDMSNAIGTFGGTWEFINNIVVNTNDLPYWVIGGGYAFVPPAVSNNNLWHNPSGAVSAPSWDTAPLTSDPGFIDATNGFFNLQQTASAKNAGADTSLVLIRDFRGIKRGLSKPYSIGAFEFISSTVPTKPQLLSIE